MKSGVKVCNINTYDMDELYAKFMVVSQHRYINLSDLWKMGAGLGHSRYL